MLRVCRRELIFSFEARPDPVLTGIGRVITAAVMTANGKEVSVGGMKFAD